MDIYNINTIEYIIIALILILGVILVYSALKKMFKIALIVISCIIVIVLAEIFFDIPLPHSIEEEVEENIEKGRKTIDEELEKAIEKGKEVTEEGIEKVKEVIEEKFNDSLDEILNNDD